MGFLGAFRQKVFAAATSTVSSVNMAAHGRWQGQGSSTLFSFVIRHVNIATIETTERETIQEPIFTGAEGTE